MFSFSAGSRFVHLLKGDWFIKLELINELYYDARPNKSQKTDLKVAVNRTLERAQRIYLTPDFKVGNRSHTQRDIHTSDAVLPMFMK